MFHIIVTILLSIYFQGNTTKDQYEDKIDADNKSKGGDKGSVCLYL